VSEQSREQKIIELGQQIPLLRHEFNATKHGSSDAVKKGRALVAAEEQLNRLIAEDGEESHRLA
jgi:hypothetical protein